MFAITMDVPLDTVVYTRINDALGDEPLQGLLLQMCVRKPEGDCGTSRSGKARSRQPAPRRSASTRSSLQPSAARRRRPR